MKQRSIIIFSTSYILRTGIFYFINENFPGNLVWHTGSKDDLHKLLENNVALLLIDAHDKPLFDEPSDFSSIKTLMWISRKNDDNDNICMSCEKEMLVKRFAVLLNKQDLRTEPGSFDKNGALSERELSVLTKVAQGFTNKEISDKLYISMHTVITHRKNITSKLGIKTISGLTVYAILNGLITPEEANK